jgi:hypothetical protein
MCQPVRFRRIIDMSGYPAEQTTNGASSIRISLIRRNFSAMSAINLGTRAIVRGPQKGGWGTGTLRVNSARRRRISSTSTGRSGVALG